MPRRPPPALFDESSEEEAARDARPSSESESVDAAVFGYDAVYDTMKEEQLGKRKRGPDSTGPKYMASLLETASRRKREMDVLYNKRKIREQEQEDEPTESFITSAYKRQLDEDRAFEEKQQQCDAPQSTSPPTRAAPMAAHLYRSVHRSARK